MQINFNQSLLNIEKAILKDENDKEFTLKKAAVNALLAETPESQKESGEEKVKRWKLANRIFEAPETEAVEVTAEEITLIKKKINEAYTTIVVGSSFQILEAPQPLAAPISSVAADAAPAVAPTVN